MKRVDPTKPKLKAGIYARVSTADQTYAMQLTEVCEYAERNGWQIIEYPEKMSSMKKRPVLDRMMEDARLKKIDIVLVWKLDRFARSVRDLTENIQKLDAWGVRFVAVTQGIDTDKRNPTSRLTLHILSAVAEFEREIIVERITAGKRQYDADFAAGKVGPGMVRQSKSGKNLPSGRPRRLFRRDQAAELRAQGKSFREISKLLGIPVSTVADALRTKPA